MDRRSSSSPSPSSSSSRRVNHPSLSEEGLIKLAEAILAKHPCGLVPESLREAMKRESPQSLTDARLASVLGKHSGKFRSIAVDLKGRIHVWALISPIHVRVNLLEVMKLAQPVPPPSPSSSV